VTPPDNSFEASGSGELFRHVQAFCAANREARAHLRGGTNALLRYIDRLETERRTADSLPSGAPQVFKRGLDLIVSGTLLVVLSPVLLFLCVAIKLDSRGPVFFKQSRLGAHGRPFWMIKFRTMISNASARREAIDKRIAGGPIFKIQNDPRVTRLGRLLRRSSLDELPELLNVVRGDMSLVGPQARIATGNFGDRRSSLSMLPGVTGVWRFGERWLAAPEEMAVLESWYLIHWSLRLDLKLLLLSIVPTRLSEKSRTLASARRRARAVAREEDVKALEAPQTSLVDADLGWEHHRDEELLPLYRLYGVDVARYVDALVHDTETANEIAFDSLGRVARRFEEIDRDSGEAEDLRFSVQVFRDARRAALNYLRGHSNPARYSGTEARMERALYVLDDHFSFVSEKQDAFRAALEYLPEDQREVLVLRHFLGLRDEDIAATLERSMLAVENLRREARRALLKRLHEDERAIQDLIE
jgi:lipopolysaccharide/colanic/teichoic acid biosynthesis glycosyltransferase/DNA-directed RNA polymerase specialized sigma24 family protein